MDVSRFTIDPALAKSADLETPRMSAFIDRIFTPLFEKDENLFAKAELSSDREILLCVTALHWLGSGKNTGRGKKALYLSFEPQAASKAFAASRALCAALGDRAKVAIVRTDGQLEGDTDAMLLFADLESVGAAASASAISLREFGFVVADQAELMAEVPGERQRKLLGGLLPSWERKTLVVAEKHTPRAKNFAWDIADNPAEAKLSESLGFAATAPTVSRDLVEADKIRYLLMLARDSSRKGPICAFCNLKSTAIELSIRLGMNGLGTDYITGNLNPDRKNQIVDKAVGWSSGAFVLVLTDEGCKGIARSVFPAVVNYDIPLEPEFYFERLSLLDKSAADSRVYNLVDERYMYGLPAIERAIDTSLGVTGLQPGETLSEDVSAGKHIEMPEPRMRGRDGRRDGRRDRPGGHDEGRQDFGRRDEGSRGNYDRADRRDTRSKDEARRAPQAPRQPESAKDPYAMSMEERLAYYRRKYGSRAEKKPADGTSSGRLERPARTCAPQQQVAGEAVKPASPAEPSPSVDSAGEDGKSRGFLGKLQDIFGSRKE